MAHLDLGHLDSKPRGLRDGHEEAVRRTQAMLAATAIGSVSIIVVAALFMSLF
ncbi:MAG: hypothetical protein Q8L54_00020 [Devosia sp.]|nr:hypothetical protein [Devosia sp.]